MYPQSTLKSPNAALAQIPLAIRPDNPDRLLSLLEVRQVLNCSYSHLNSLLAKGIIKPWQPCKRGNRRVRASELQRYLQSGDRPC